jgi:SNF2 family DNA or RNA helicase
VATQADSQAFAKSPLLRQVGRDDEPIPPIMNAKTTLLIAPLTALVNWEDQIEAHVQQGALTSYVYHGARREKDPKVLAGFDMVFTTYQVIANEYSKHMKNSDSFVSPLQQIKFFRIVLDG